MDQDRSSNPRSEESTPYSRRVGTHTLREFTLAADRPREKAMKVGVENLTNAELLAIVIGSGSAGENVVELCSRILRDHKGKLYELARDDYQRLMHDYHGVGEVKALQIMSALQLAKNYQLEQFDGRYQIRSSEDAYRYLRPRMEHLDHEEVKVILLNNNKEVTECKDISSGGTTMTVADVKMILRPAVMQMAAGIILAHNHPSDNPNPSAADDKLTEHVRQACRVMDMELVDHIIVCRGGRYYSYVDHGKL